MYCMYVSSRSVLLTQATATRIHPVWCRCMLVRMTADMCNQPLHMFWLIGIDSNHVYVYARTSLADEACWKAVSAEVARVKMQKQ